MSTEDGPGIRTTVFMKGCPLKCIWCQNPEGLTTETHLVHDRLRCIACGTCLENCPTGSITKAEQGLFFGSDCKKCLSCANSCPADAIKVIGSTITAAELKKIIIQDRPFYDNSGGGVTFSGGECLLQHKFLTSFIPKIKEAGIHVCIDTAGYSLPEHFLAVAELSDLVLFDLKVMDDREHKKFTGVSNKPILENARRLGRSGVPFWIRIAVIPGCTDSTGNIKAAAAFIKQYMPDVERVDLLGYNDLCRSDYQKLGLNYALDVAGRVKESTMRHFMSIIEGAGVSRVTISNYREGE